jgi:hypothetical protein
MVVSKRYNRGRYVVDMYEFQHGGDGDVQLCDFVSDAEQGFKVPAQSLVIQNHGGGAGDNWLYYKTIHTAFGSSKFSRLRADEFINYQLGETVVWGVLLYASNANLRYSIVATPGEWHERDVEEFLANSPATKKTLSYMYDQISLGEIVI